MFNWNRNHAEYLRQLNDRFQAHQGRGRGRNGRKLSERQYAIARFRAWFNVDSSNLSDQAIWAKYQRVNGKGKVGGARQANRQALAVIERKYKSSTGHVFTPGMIMDDWKDLGLEYLGQGATRTVFALGDDAVLKVAHQKYGGRFDGVKSNQREVDTWRKVANGADADHFTKVLAADPNNVWVVEERVTPEGVTAEDMKHLRRIADRNRVSDLHHGNVGYRGNVPVILDYASA